MIDWIVSHANALLLLSSFALFMLVMYVYVRNRKTPEEQMEEFTKDMIDLQKICRSVDRR